jgi:hypothetical protein
LPLFSPHCVHRIHPRLHSTSSFAAYSNEEHLIVVGHGMPQDSLHDDANRLAECRAFPVASNDLADKIGDGEVRASGILLANVRRAAQQLSCMNDAPAYAD